MANITGGSVAEAVGKDTSTLNVSGGVITNFIVSAQDSRLNISGGTVSRAETGNKGTINISGGTLNHTLGHGVGTINVTGGSLQGGIFGNDFSTLNLVGGSMSKAISYNSSVLNMSGQALSRFVASHDSGTVNIKGGWIGGIDFNITDRIYTGLYNLGGTLNLYGSDFLLTDPVPGKYKAQDGTFNGIYSTLTGTLLDGTPINTTFFLADGLTFHVQGGSSQNDALPANSIQDGVFTFSDTPSDAWFNFPMVSSYRFAMTDGKLFTAILGLPSGIGDADGLFTVLVNGTSLGQFSWSESINFADFGFAEGVSSFVISGINPLFEAGNSDAFPVRLGFNSGFASFTMQGFSVAAPEPVSLCLCVLGSGFLIRGNGHRQASSRVKQKCFPTL